MWRGSETTESNDPKPSNPRQKPLRREWLRREFSGQSERNDVNPGKLAPDVHVNQYREYNLLFASFALALLGTGVAVIGIVLLAFDLASDDAGAVLGTALAIKTATYVVVAPMAAILFGTVPKRRLMLILVLVGALTILLLPLVTSVWQLYALIFVFAAGSAVFNPTYQALVAYFMQEPARITGR